MKLSEYQRSRSFFDFGQSSLRFQIQMFDFGPVYSGERFRASWPSCFFFLLKNGILCVLIRIASMRQFLCEHTIYRHVKENWKDITIFPPDLALELTLIGSNYPCLEHIFMVPKVFEPLKFYCMGVALC